MCKEDYDQGQLRNPDLYSSSLDTLPICISTLRVDMHVYAFESLSKVVMKGHFSSEMKQHALTKAFSGGLCAIGLESARTGV